MCYTKRNSEPLRLLTLKIRDMLIIDWELVKSFPLLRGYPISDFDGQHFDMKKPGKGGVRKKWTFGFPDLYIRGVLDGTIPDRKTVVTGIIVPSTAVANKIMSFSVVSKARKDRGKKVADKTKKVKSESKSELKKLSRTRVSERHSSPKENRTIKTESVEEPKKLPHAKVNKKHSSPKASWIDIS